MTGQHAYDAIAARYRESKWLLFRHYIERYTPSCAKTRPFLAW